MSQKAWFDTQLVWFHTEDETSPEGPKFFIFPKDRSNAGNYVERQYRL